MSHYFATHHAVDRLIERFPALVPIAGRGHAAARWLGRLATRAKVAAQQSEMDLMLCVEVTVADGLLRMYLPVTPQSGNRWIIRTVLTEEQAQANQAQFSTKNCLEWRARKGFTRPFAQRQRRAQRLTRVAA